jgi:flagellin-like hook-associated protein FlgL
MGFRINTNVDALMAYNALAMANKETVTSQLRIATGKRINSVADDTTGFMVGKSLEAKNEIQKSQLNNASAAKNYLSTAEASLTQINDLLTQIAGKSADVQDPTKDKAAIAGDIRAIATEIDSLMKHTSFNGHNLLARDDGSALARSDTFGIGGAGFTADFASNTYLKADDLKTALHGTPVVSQGGTPPTAFFQGQEFTFAVNGVDVVANSGPDTTASFKVMFADGTSVSDTVQVHNGATMTDLKNGLESSPSLDSNSPLQLFDSGWDPGGTMHMWARSVVPGSGNTQNNANKIVSIQNTGGFDIIGKLGLQMDPQSSSSSGGMMSSDTDTVLAAAQSLSTVTDNVRSSLGRLGNLQQTVDMRSTYLTNSISSNSASDLPPEVVPVIMLVPSVKPWHSAVG